MTRKEAAGVIKFEKACVLRQDTPRCNRDCKKCDLLLPTEDVLTAYDMAIKALEQEPRWIPVSERMPEPRIDVWCNSDMGQMVGYYDEYAETWYSRDYLELIVTAWMPLPEPYKAGSED